MTVLKVWFWWLESMKYLWEKVVDE